MDVVEQGFVGVGAGVFGVFLPEFDDAVEFVEADGDAVVVAVDGREVVCEGGVHRAEVGHRPHLDFVGADGHHGGGGGALQGNQADEAAAVAADEVDHAQGFFARAAVAFDEEVDGVVLVDVFEDAVEGEHVVAADAAAVAVPIAQKRGVQTAFQFGDDFLCFGKQARGLFDDCFVFTHDEPSFFVCGRPSPPYFAGCRF